MSLRRAFNVFLFASISDVRSGIRFQIVRVISVKGFANVHSGVTNRFAEISTDTTSLNIVNENFHHFDRTIIKIKNVECNFSMTLCFREN